MNNLREHVASRPHRCPHCVYRKLLVDAEISTDEIQSLGDLTTHRRGPFHRGDFIYRTGDEAGSIFVLQSGSAKTQCVTFDGQLRVNDFVFTGELFGLDALGQAFHESDAIALERTWVCEVPMDRLEALCTDKPKFQHQVFGLLGRELRHSEFQGLTTRNSSAETRVMCFLNDLYRRTSTRLGNVREIRLPMRKVDIASFLALTPEHLSRILREFEDSGLIRNHFRSIEYLDSKAFRGDGSGLRSAG